MSIAAIPIFLILIILILIPFIVGAYVYRDARRRRMNALLWAFVAALAPSLIGLIIYLLVRGNYSDLKCPVCSAPVTDQYMVCPKCGAKLRPSCPNCAMPIETDWNVCPRCAQSLPATMNDIQAPEKAKDKSLWKIVSIAIVIPVLLIGILLLSLSVSFGGGSVSLREIAVSDYYEEMDEEVIAEDIRIWMDSLDLKSHHAYALQYDRITDSGNEYYFLIYVPGAGNQTNTGIGQSNSIFGTTLKLNLSYTGSSGSFFCLLSSADKAPNLKITMDGKKIPCDVTTVDYNPTTFYIVPQYDELKPGSENIFYPERLSVVKLISNHNTGVVEIEDEDLCLDILVAIDKADYLDLEDPIYGLPDGSGGYDFTDGFSIIIEYEIQEDLVLHDSMIECLVFEQDGKYYLIDSYRPDNGRIIRQIDESFYQLLESLFEQ